MEFWKDNCWEYSKGVTIVYEYDQIVWIYQQKFVLQNSFMV